MVKHKAAPPWFADIEYISWYGETKNLNFIRGARLHDVVLVDDFEMCVHPGQESQWLQVDYFDYPYKTTDAGLAKILTVLEERVRGEA